METREWWARVVHSNMSPTNECFKKYSMIHNYINTTRTILIFFEIDLLAKTAKLPISINEGYILKMIKKNIK